MPLGMEDIHDPNDIVLHDPKGGRAPQFSAHVCCGQTAGWIKMALGREVGLSPDDFVLGGDPAPPQKGGGAPNFRPISVVAKWLDGLRCHLVWRWASARTHCARRGPSSRSPKKGADTPPIFGPCLSWPNGCMDQDANWYGGRPRPAQHCVRRGPSYPRK